MRSEPDVLAARRCPLNRSLDGAFQVGSRSAAVAIIVYLDFQCPFCAKAAAETLPKILRDYVANGKALFVFRHLPLQSIHPFAVKAAEAAECAKRQGKFLEMHDSLFRNQRALQTDNLQKLSVSIGLRRAEFEECLTDGATKTVENDIADAKRLHITGTPTFLFGTLQSDGRVKLQRQLSGAISVDALSSVMSALLIPTGGADESDESTTRDDSDCYGSVRYANERNCFRCYRSMVGEYGGYRSQSTARMGAA